MRVSRAAPKRPTGLVLVPTRELAAQVCGELEWLGRQRKLRVAAVYGGAGFGAQLKALRRGVDVLVACPGRLTDLMERGEVRLDAVEIVVVDEADRMADMGFLPVVQRLLDATPKTRQTLLFSATLDGAVDTLVRRYQRDPVRHALPDTSTDKPRATHLFWSVHPDKRVALCADVIKLAGPTIVFCKTKRGTDRIARRLDEAGVRTEAIHGNRSQSQRERALAAFAKGSVDALVATDVAARGIHVDNVACVVHFDLPNDSKDYMHRSGRTARAGEAGTVVTFVGTQQAREAAQIQQALGMRRGLDRPDRDALASITPEAVNRRDLVKTGVAAVAAVTAPSPSTCAGTPPPTGVPSSGSMRRRASASSSAPTATTSSCTSARSKVASSSASTRASWSTTRSARAARARRRRRCASSRQPRPDAREDAAWLQTRDHGVSQR